MWSLRESKLYEKIHMGDFKKIECIISVLKSVPKEYMPHPKGECCSETAVPEEPA